MKAIRCWQVNVLIRTPMALEILEGPTEPQGMPTRFGEKYAVFDNVFSVNVSDDIHIAVSPFLQKEEWSITINSAPARCVMYYNGSDGAMSALDRSECYFEEAFDKLSFLWDYPVSAYKAYILDVTHPVNVGDLREMQMHVGYSNPKYRHSRFHTMDPLNPTSSFNLDARTEKFRAALRWYAMGTERLSDVQRFMAFWIALELIVQDETENVTQPYRADCGHEIPFCPICNKSTSRSVGGARIREFLTNFGEIDKADASALWRMRQVVHGNNKLRPEDIKDIPKRLGQLWIVVRKILGSRIGATARESVEEPIATAAMVMDATMEVQAHDLDIAARTYPPVCRPLQRVEMPPTAFVAPSEGQ